MNDRPTAAPTDEQLHAFLMVAREKHRAGELQEAEGMYRHALKLKPDWADAVHMLGLLAAQVDEHEEGIKLLRHAIALDPSVADYHANLGTVLKLTNRLDEAEAALREALRLAPDSVPAMMNLGVLLRNRRKLDEAAPLLEGARALAPDNPDTAVNLGNLRRMQKREDEALELYRWALERQPAMLSAYQSMASSAYVLGKLNEAAAAFRRILDVMPDNEIARFLLASCEGENLPRPPLAYVQGLFDDYAANFDTSLTALKYQAPALVGEAAAEHLDGRRVEMALDAGCGTGLVGPLLRPLAENLIGLDLSTGMLARARARGCYDDLIAGDLTEWPGAQVGAFDLVTVVDTLCYLGDLTAGLKSLATALKPGGTLIATVEALPEDAPASPGYLLTPSGRYSHHPDYLSRQIAAAGLTLDRMTPCELRMELGDPVAGLLLIATKSQ